ncbi:MAG TPA: Gfo/Idh/MocA family oxidoreductase [Fimbriimonadaceae bacterium]|jgi:predicted dehydrogenase
MTKKLRLGMVGGGVGAFIGAVHRNAAWIDGCYDLVCGAFSSTAERSKESGADLRLNPSRVYGSYRELFEKERALPESEKMQVVAIVTPNHVHFEPTKLALESGFHVVLDKPMTYSLTEAQELAKVIKATGKRFCLTHTYTGYPMVKEARQLIREGKIGRIRKIYVEYPQGWLSTFLEGSDQKQAAWRTDPARSGVAGCMGDIGTHAFNLAEYVSGLKVTKLCADINTYVEGRKLDDDGDVLLRFEDGASGTLFATQVAAGAENNVNIRVYGEKGGVEWRQEDCNSLIVRSLDGPAQIYRAGTGYVGTYSKHDSRTPAGHPEGYLEAFANLYRNFALCVNADLEGKKTEPEWEDYPGVEDGVRGMAFIESVIESGKSDKKWFDFPSV